MRRPIVPVAVVALGLLAGAAIAGLPTTVANDVSAEDLLPAQTSTSTTASTTTTTSPPTATSPAATSTLATIATSSSAATPASGLDVNLLVGNASGIPGVASGVGEDLRALGYVNVAVADSEARRPKSVVLYSPGFEDEARLLATQRGVDAVEPRGSEVVTTGDAPADVWLIVGADLP